MNFTLEKSWSERLSSEFKKDYFCSLASFVENEYQNGTIFPPKEDLFSAFELCPFGNVKVVIIGQDPYHGKGQAHGLAFSVREGIKIPPSLLNIFKEIERDLGVAQPLTGNLENWAKQGVLMINSVLTVREGEAASHQKKGWEKFTDAAIEALNREKSGVVYMLWGAHAWKKGSKIDPLNNCILQSSHPSPLSVYRGFNGCSHFSKANDYLIDCGNKPIIWG